MSPQRTLTIGVLALQGAFSEHVHKLQAATEHGSYPETRFCFPEVRTASVLVECDALIIPGGESTAISLIAERTGMLEPLMAFVAVKPVWGTCAGLIFLARECLNAKPNQHFLGGMEIQVSRNAFGRQMDSFTSLMDFSDFIKGGEGFPAIFIRAPVVTKLLGPGGSLPTDPNVRCSTNAYRNPARVEILKQLDENGLIVAVRQGNKLATAFHPELSSDYRFHKWFIDAFVL